MNSERFTTKSTALRPGCVAIVGPSGVGKSAALQIARDAGIPVISREKFTERPAREDDDATSVSRQRLLQEIQQEPHITYSYGGYYYAIPERTLDRYAAQSGVVLFVVPSLRVIASLRQQRPCAAVLITADENVVRTRLRSAGQSIAMIQQRLQRNTEFWNGLASQHDFAFDAVINNSGSYQEYAHQLLRLLPTIS